jgi:hypothetical protein
MLEPNMITYLEKYILKSGEELDYSVLTPSPFSELKIIERIERTYREVGLLLISTNTNSESLHVDKEIMKIKFTPTKKVQLVEHDSSTLKWLDQGWIIKEIRICTYKNKTKAYHSYTKVS